MHATIARTFSLKDFDLNFNGAFTGERLDEITSGGFIDRGENLIIVGGNGSGKTMIARCTEANAVENGKKCVYLYDACDLLEPHKLALLGTDAYDPSTKYRQEYLDADVLIIDHAERWLGGSGFEPMGLLGVRAELGRSNVLIFTSQGLARVLDAELRFLRSQAEGALQTVYARDNTMRWPTIVFFGLASTHGQLLQAMGLDLSTPGLPHLDTLRRAQYPLRRHLDREPVWQVLPTGENSYRQFENAQRAA